MDKRKKKKSIYNSNRCLKSLRQVELVGARLFALYAELIINKIDETKIGIKIGKTNADNIILLT